MGPTFIFLLISFLWSFTVEGYITNSSTSRLISDVNIDIINKDSGTSSDINGFYKLNLSKGNYIIQASSIGFETQDTKFSLNQDTTINIMLNPIVLQYDEVQVKGLLSSRLNYESIDLITLSDLSTKNKNTIPDLLKSINGINAHFSHSYGRNVNVSIRGSSDYKPGGYNNRILVLLNSVPVLIPSSGSPDWNSLPLENLKRIEINNSAASTQYGHNSMGGVINLVTETKPLNKVRFSTGSFNNNTISYISNKKYDNHSFGFFSIINQSDGHRYNSDHKSYKLNSFAKLKNKQGTEYLINYLLSNSNIGHPGFDLDGSNKYRRSNRLSNYLHFNIFRCISPNLTTSNSLYYNSFYTKYRNRLDIPQLWLDENQLDAHTNYSDKSFGLRSEFLSTKFYHFVFMLGCDFDLSQTKVDLLNQQYGKPQQMSLGSYIQTKYLINQSINLNFGIRYDYRSINPENNFATKIYTSLSPKLNLTYKTKRNNLFNINISKGFRAPSISELYLKHITTYGLIVSGNPKLEPENVYSYEINYKNHQNNFIYWDISIFQNKYNNMIDFIYDIPTLAKNRSRIIGEGLEINSSISIFKKITIKCNYNYLNMTDFNNVDVLYRSKHKGRVSLNFNYNIDISISSQAQSYQYYEDFLEPFDYVSGFPIKKLPGNIISDINFSKTIGNFVITLKISNLFNHRYELIQNYTMPGRNGYISITKILNKDKK